MASDLDLHCLPLSHKNDVGAQWLSGRVLASRQEDRGFEAYRRHCVVVLEQISYPCLVLDQHKKTC